MSNLIHLPEELKKEFKLYPDGKTSCSFRGVARMFLVSNSSLTRHFGADRNQSQLFKTLAIHGFDFQNSAGLDNWAGFNVPLEAVVIIAQYYLYESKQVSEKTKEKAKYFLNAIVNACQKDEKLNSQIIKYLTIKQIAPPVKPRKTKTTPEKVIQNNLNKVLKGLLEVKTLVGNIDILTDKYLIEVKNANAWKGGVGQLLMYGHYYPKHQKVLYLFGAIQTIDLNLVTYLCSDFNIDVVTDDCKNLYFREELKLIN